MLGRAKHPLAHAMGLDESGPQSWMFSLISAGLSLCVL